MVYDGQALNQCGVIDIDCSNLVVVAVSGDGPNVCGHLLIHTGPRRGGYYFHVAEFHGPPRYMNESEYRRYLREAGKVELRRLPISVPNPQDAVLYLENLMANNWTWLILPNNCVAFVEEVIRAGGGNWSSVSNCPSIATKETLKQQIERFLNQIEGAIYQLYRAPRL